MIRHNDRFLGTDSSQHHSRPSIADRYSDLLDLLDSQQRQSLIVRLTVGYYENWRPSRSEMADVVAVTLKLMSVEESEERQRIRNAGGNPMTMTAELLRTRARQRYQG